ncbi:ABC transporter substrate-binding protein [Candidatus Kaiserbacteria bacterium]|nr:ABC transporter substrate-binding protein [Candidatus Kaiserbacteria bacterium]
MKKGTIAIVIGIIIILGIGYAVMQRSDTKSSSNQKIRIGVNVYPGSGAFYIAQEKGFFEKHGVDVEVVMLQVDNIAQSLASNDVQMLYMSTDVLSVFRDAGMDAKQIFAPSISNGADGFVATDDVRDISDLKGKEVYLGIGFPSHFLTRYVMAQNGLKYSDVKLINMSPEDVGASFVSGNINAGATWEPWLSKATERKGAKVLFTSKDVPGIIVDAAIVREDTIEKQREDLKNVMRAFFDAVDWWAKNPQEGNEIAAKALSLTSEEFVPTLATVKLFGLQDNLQTFDKSNPLNVYYLSEYASKIYAEDKVIKNSFDGDSMIDGSLLTELR